MVKKVSRQWFEEQDEWTIDKSFILRALQDLIYSYQGSFLPCNCEHSDDRQCQVNPFSDVHLGARS